MSDKYSGDIDATDPMDEGLDPPEKLALELADHELQMMPWPEAVALARQWLISFFGDMPEDALRKRHKDLFNPDITYH